MFEHLNQQPADKILELMQLFRDDPRENKVDLGVGVYKDAEGRTPVMRAIKTAEKQLWEAETSKSYVGILGDGAFNSAMRTLILADSVAVDRLASAATPIPSTSRRSASGTPSTRASSSTTRRRTRTSSGSWPSSAS